MTIDNQRNTYKIWLGRLITTIVFTIAILIVVFLPWFDQEKVSFTKYHLVILISVIYVALNLYNFLKRPHFISYSDQGDRVVLRYYPLSFFNSRKNSIEIPKTQFVKYDLLPFFLGSQQELVLYQNFRNKEAKYPAISLSALDKDDREKLIASLEKNLAK